jgi:ubiquinone/menaquinone biosynthesis C-methylase UbiE
MKLITLTFLFIGFSSFGFSQGTDRKSREKIVPFLNFKVADNVADIGSGDLKRIMDIALYFPGTFFTFQDIDSTTCNWKKLTKQWKKTGKKTNLKNFSIVYGDTVSTRLKSNYYDHVTIFASLHEFTDQHGMLQDIKRILKKEGFLYIYEDITPDSITLFCPSKAQYFKSSRFFSLLRSENIKVIDQKLILDDNDLQEIIFKCAFTD